MTHNPTAAMIDRYGKVAVLMGGWSAEREVSLMSGAQVLSALQQSGVDAHAIDVDRDVIARLQAEGFDRVFNVLHGRGGEDGEIQGALQLAGIAYTGSGIMASSLAMDKLKSKEVCHARGILTPQWRVVESYEACRAAAEAFGFPIVVKPVSEGSSIGVSIVRESADLAKAWEAAALHGQVLAEQFIAGMEVTAAVLEGEALPLVSMSTDRDFYDYEAKYFDDDTVYRCPCGLAEELEQEIRAVALTVFNALNVTGWGRVDFMLDADHHAHFIEINTIPGMTTHSLVPMAAAQAGIDFNALCLRILDSSLGVNK
jgi:D-alanine-D-alanine ligase